MNPERASSPSSRAPQSPTGTDGLSDIHFWICWCRGSSTETIQAWVLPGAEGGSSKSPVLGVMGWMVELPRLSPGHLQPPHWMDCTDPAATPEQELCVWARPRFCLSFCLCQPSSQSAWAQQLSRTAAPNRSAFLLTAVKQHTENWIIRVDK